MGYEQRFALLMIFMEKVQPNNRFGESYTVELAFQDYRKAVGFFTGEAKSDVPASA